MFDASFLKDFFIHFWLHPQMWSLKKTVDQMHYYNQFTLSKQRLEAGRCNPACVSASRDPCSCLPCSRSIHADRITPALPCPAGSILWASHSALAEERNHHAFFTNEELMLTRGKTLTRAIRIWCSSTGTWRSSPDSGYSASSKAF